MQYRKGIEKKASYTINIGNIKMGIDQNQLGAGKKRKRKKKKDSTKRLRKKMMGCS